MTKAWGHAFAYGRDTELDITVTLRHDNGTQFTCDQRRSSARDCAIKLSCTAYRHPDGNAFVERVNRTMEEEAV